jgi:hypothetical protein
VVDVDPKEKTEKMYNQRVKVIGGVQERHEEGEGTHKKSWNTFTTKRTIVVEAKNLASLFRREPDLCSMSCKIQNTQDALTPGYFFSEW